jgi:Flp pilus assembly protein TadG
MPMRARLAAAIRRLGRTSGLAALGRDRRGVSAVEFAILLPLMITLFFGGTELSQAITIYRKVGHTATVLGDLVTQSSTMNTTDMNNIFDAAKAIMSPYSSSDAKLLVAALSWSGSAWKIEWVKSQGTGAATGWTAGSAPPTSGTTPSNLQNTAQWVIVSKVDYTYTSAFSAVWNTTSIALGDIAYLRPRLSATIPFT